MLKIPPLDLVCPVESIEISASGGSHHQLNPAFQFFVRSCAFQLARSSRYSGGSSVCVSDVILVYYT
jgi:hypothetical protein